MREESKTSTVLRYKDVDGAYVYVGAVRRSGTALYINDVYEFPDAMDFVNESKESILEAYLTFQRENREHVVELAKVTVQYTVEDVLENDQDLKELQQQIALSKLSEQDIKVLGLLPIAIYIKTKFHNV